MILDILCGVSMFALFIAVLTVIAYILLIKEGEEDDGDKH